MRVITFFNNKGGVGKTTLAVNIASYFSTNFDKKILFLDADPQANSTQMIIKEEEWQDFYGEEASQSTLLNFLMPIEEGDATLNLSFDPYPLDQNRFKIDLIPGHPRLSIIEDILSDSWNKCVGGDLGGFRKTNWLNLLKTYFSDNYDFMIIDVGPSLGALNRSILLNSEFMITPMGSDIFSLLGVSNISTWIMNWMTNYVAAIGVLERKHGLDSADKYHINLDLNNSCRLIGYSIQQYVTKTFTSGRRPVASYDRIIKKIPESIMSSLGYLVYDDLGAEDLNLGDVPYLYSLVPLAQSNKAPMYDLKSADGIVGGQAASVKKYKLMIDNISSNILRNIGESYDD